MPIYLPPTLAYDAIIFDCDGTLSAIEGIDELATMNHVGPKVAELTQIAMGQTGITPDLYRQRLQLVNPTSQQINDLGNLYSKHQSPDAYAVIQVLQRLKKSIYILSAGVAPAVIHFGMALHIPRHHIHAVDINFDLQGRYAGFDERSPLIHNDGKRILVDHIKQKHPTIAYIGDGMNDLSVKARVNLFIGYGGFFYRENIAKASDIYLTNASYAQLLPLLLTKEENKQLTHEETILLAKGAQLLPA